MTFHNSSNALVGNTTFHDLVSGGNGQTYRVFVYRPPGEAPEHGWPILYMTDGNAVIGTAVDAMRAQASYPGGTNVSDGIIVSIGYPTDAAYDPLRRSWDLGPPPGKTYPPFFANTPEVRTGGAEAFLSFVEGQVKPLVEAELPVDPERQALFGHSFGGLFVLYALFTRPASFSTWLAASPSIYWEDCAINAFFAQFSANPATRQGARLHLSCGEYETDRLAPFHKGAADEAERIEKLKIARTDHYAFEMAERLHALPNRPIAVDVEIHPGENHMSLLPVAVNRAVQRAFAIRK